jgi:Homeodomain-like domain
MTLTRDINRERVMLMHEQKMTVKAIAAEIGITTHYVYVLLKDGKQRRLESAWRPTQIPTQFQTFEVYSLGFKDGQAAAASAMASAEDRFVRAMVNAGGPV